MDAIAYLCNVCNGSCDYDNAFAVLHALHRKFTTTAFLCLQTDCERIDTLIKTVFNVITIITVRTL